MKTAELIKEIANELMLDADYYGAYIDEVRKLKCDTFKEFEEQMKPIDEKYSAIRDDRASALLLLLNQQVISKLEESEENLEKTVN